MGRLLPPPSPDARYASLTTGRPVRAADVFVYFAPGEPAHLSLMTVAGMPVREMWPDECGCGICEECRGRLV